MPVLQTRDIAERILRVEIAGIRRAIATARRLSPEAGVTSMEFAGGLAAFTGADSPLSQVFGATAPVSANDVAALTAFYETRDATPQIFVFPFSDASIAFQLAAAGYAPCEYENVLASDSFDSEAAYDHRIGIAPDLEAWAAASARAFTERDALTPGDLSVARVIAFSDGVSATQAQIDGTIVATAAMDINDGCAALFAGSTLPAFRGRGWQVAMIRDRIARARNGGARLMRGTAQPMSVSERNFIRCGFQALFTRTLWKRHARD